MKAAPKPREVIGNKRFRCDTKNGKRCEPIATPSWYSGTDVRCKYCKKIMAKPRSN